LKQYIYLVCVPPPHAYVQLDQSYKTFHSDLLTTLIFYVNIYFSDVISDLGPYYG